MKFSSIFAVAGLVATVSAAPFDKRDLVVVTDIVTATDMTYETTIVWVTGNVAAPTSASAASVDVPAPTSAAPAKQVQPSQDSAAVPMPVVIPTTVAPAAAPPAPSATAIQSSAPAPAVSSAPAPAVTTAAAPAPAPAATTAPVAAPQPASTSSSSASGGMAAVGMVYRGEMTYYDVGMGSCGQTSTSGEHVLAVSKDIFDNPQYATANPNNNPLCGRMLSITYGGKTVAAKVVDRCAGCAPGHIDLSQGLFEEFGSTDAGVLNGATWTWQ